MCVFSYCKYNLCYFDWLKGNLCFAYICFTVDTALTSYFRFRAAIQGLSRRCLMAETRLYLGVVVDKVALF
jgi:hypothetical protein